MGIERTDPLIVPRIDTGYSIWNTFAQKPLLSQQSYAAQVVWAG